jgi:Ras homolog gene family, member A
MSWIRYSSIAILVVIVPLTMAFLLQWYPEVLHFCPTTPIILCGLKSDLRNNNTCINLLKAQGLAPITPEQGRAVATRMGAVYMECSAKERIGVEDIFDSAIVLATDQEDDASNELDGHGDGGKFQMLSKVKKRKARRMCKIF